MEIARQKKPRSTKIELRRRRRTVEQMLHRCITHTSIEATLSEKWRCTTRTIRDYIRKVYEDWQADADRLAPARHFQRREQMEGVLEKAMVMDPPDLRTAMICLDRLCRLDACYPEARAKIMVTHNGEVGLKAMTSHDKRKALDALFEEYKGALVETESDRKRKANGKTNGSGSN